MSDHSKTSVFKAIPLNQMRRFIAARMVEATQTIPHFRLSAEIEVDRLIELRRQLLSSRTAKLSLNDLLIKACAAALMDEPALNIQWIDNEIRQFESADVAVVTAIEGGLSTPIIRHADLKSVWEIAQEARELAARAKAKTLKIGEIVGGSFSISNLGMYGVDQFDAIINPPQCAILAVGRAKRGVRVTEDHQIRTATVVTVTLSCDHRAVDGATGARFLSALRQRLENAEDLV